jgi:hypothetical protein
MKKKSTKKHRNPKTRIIKVKYEALVHLKSPVSGIPEKSVLKNVASIIHEGINALRFRSDGRPAINGVSDGRYTLSVFFPKEKKPRRKLVT